MSNEKVPFTHSLTSSRMLILVTPGKIVPSKSGVTSSISAKQTKEGRNVK